MGVPSNWPAGGTWCRRSASIVRATRSVRARRAWKPPAAKWPGARAALGVPLEAPATDQASVRQAMAARDVAALQLSYTDIRAPITGVLARRSAELGQRIEKGQPLTAIVPLSRVYVGRTSRRPSSRPVRVGQPAEIVADVYPKVVYHGRVESLAPGSGAAFASATARERYR